MENNKMNNNEHIKENQIMNEPVNEITILVVEPLEKPTVETVVDKLEVLQGIVGGYIEEVFPFDDNAVMVVNEYGKLDHLIPNRAIYDDEGKIADIVHGTFFIVGTDEDMYCSLTPEQIEKYQAQYQKGEMFFYHHGKVCSLPVEIYEEGESVNIQKSNHKETANQGKSKKSKAYER